MLFQAGVPCKFGVSVIVLLYNDTGIYSWLYFRKSAKLVKVAALVCL